MQKPLTILGIETSCDETAVAIVNSDRQILAHQLRTQLAEHTPYGGVVPEIASRAHLQVLSPMVQAALAEAHCAPEKLDAIAVTAGPGLIGGVIVGVMMAKSLASVLKKPLIAVNHLEGHALTVRLTDDVAFPYLMLLVSGGHCQFLLVEGVGQYHLLGGTQDDALGEAFDKVAKMLGLGMPGGPKVEALAKRGNPQAYKFPMPLCDRPGCDMSFSGLKTAVRRIILQQHEQGALNEQVKADICASFQHTVGKVLANRLGHAVEAAREHKPALSQLVVAGGVAANQHVRNVLEDATRQYDMALIAPPMALCTDNAAMIAWAGLERFQLGMVDGLNIKPRARWPLVELTGGR